MNKNDYALRLVLLKKWLGVRKGRMTILASLLDIDKGTLYSQVQENRIASEVLMGLASKQELIESLEKECLEKFDFFRRFIRKGEGRASRLAKKLNISTNIIRNLSYAKGDARFVMIKYGVKVIMDAIRELERERTMGCYGFDKLNVNQFLSMHAPKTPVFLNEIMQFADKVKEHADYGNHDGAVICSVEGGDKYKVVSVGFDSKFSDMCRSHVCDKHDPHLHGALFATLGVNKKQRESVGGLILFSHSAPCPNCAKRLISSGVVEVYCYFEPESIAGLDELAKNNIPVYKYNIVTKMLKRINAVEVGEVA